MQHDANASATQLRRVEGIPFDVAAGISKLNRIPAIGTLEAREADFASFFASLEEVGEGAVKTFEGGINNHSGQIRMGLFAMSLILLIEMHVFACLFVASDKLLKTGIVHLARCHQGLHQGLFLCLVGSHPVLIGPHRRMVAHLDYIVKRARAKADKRLTARPKGTAACGGLKPFKVKSFNTARLYTTTARW